MDALIAYLQAERWACPRSPQVEQSRPSFSTLLLEVVVHNGMNGVVVRALATRDDDKCCSGQLLRFRDNDSSVHHYCNSDSDRSSSVLGKDSTG
jgi:hypothetical protein